jgi:hypothetical protein
VRACFRYLARRFLDTRPSQQSVHGFIERTDECFLSTDESLLFIDALAEMKGVDFLRCDVFTERKDTL